MKNINEWQKFQKLNPDWAKWLEEARETKMKSYREWKIQKNLELMMEQEPPVQAGQLPPPDPNQPPGPPPSGAVQPPQMPQVPPSPQSQAPQPPTPPQPEPQQAQDDKSLVDQLQTILGQKIGSALMPAAVAMKEEAKKVKSLADQKQLNPADGLKMWLWTCVNAWQKTVESQGQTQPVPQVPAAQPPQPPQPPGQ